MGKKWLIKIKGEILYEEYACIYYSIRWTMQNWKKMWNKWNDGKKNTCMPIMA